MFTFLLFGSWRDVLTLALCQPLLLGLKCQLVHEDYSVDAASGDYSPIQLFYVVVLDSL